MKLHNLAAAISSSLGGATLALAMAKDVSLSTHKKAIAPYTLGLVSAKMCSLLHCYVAPPWESITL